MTLSLRPAVPTDAAWLLHLRNDPLTRAMSLIVGEVTPEEHQAWLLRQWQDDDAGIFIAMDGERAVGTCRYRLDRSQGSVVAELSLTVAPEARGQGYATPMIDALMREARGDGATRARALVRGENTASIRAFLRAHFQATMPVLVFERSLEDLA